MSRQFIIVFSVGVAFVGVMAAFLLLQPSRQSPKAPASPDAVRTPVTPTIKEPLRSAPSASPSVAAARPGAVPPPPPEAASANAGAAPVEAAPNLGTIHVESDVAGAQVFIDRVFIGTAPLTAPNVKPGTHRLNVSVPDYDPVLDIIEVAPGPRDIVIKFKEVRLDAKLDVVHKHRLGSCKGTLVATQQGLRYDTTDKDDAFTVPLVDIETFQVDYMAKILRIGVRGKRLEFTDPEGNADRLFVFHRDVDKARERLKKGDQPAP